MSNPEKKVLKGKKILVTAGPTWVAIDRVRVITNIFSGRTGCSIAEKAYEMGAKVTLLLGPGRLHLTPTFSRKVRVIRYYFLHELLELMRQEISQGSYDIVIHSAVVSDYEPVKTENRKIPSGKDSLIISLKPTTKIIQQIKKWDKKIYLAQFKLEVGKKLDQLIDKAYKSMQKNKANLVVANDLNKMSKNRHEAYIIDNARNITKVSDRTEMASRLLEIIEQKLFIEGLNFHK